MCHLLGPTQFSGFDVWNNIIIIIIIYVALTKCMFLCFEQVPL
jgi:hypothetical protein